MIPIHPIVASFFLLIWIALGLVLGWITGVAMTWLLPRSKSKIVVDLILGVLGCLAGVFISGWASQRTFNSGAQRADFIWDENAQAIDWRTALAENQNLVAILGAIFFVLCWHLAVAAYRELHQEIS